MTLTVVMRFAAYDGFGPFIETKTKKRTISSRNFTTASGTLYDRNAGIRPLFNDVNSGTAYDINAVGNTCSGTGSG